MADKKKKVKKLQKVAQGVVIGGAIGSILGLLLAPKKGKDTRSILNNQNKSVREKFGDIFRNKK